MTTNFTVLAFFDIAIKFVLCDQRLADFGRRVFYVQRLQYSGDLIVFWW
jgi:hypothetical protein